MMEFENGVPCRMPIIFRISQYLIWILLGAAFFSGNTGGWWWFALFWIYAGVHISLSSSDFALYEEGVEIKIGWIRTFVTWDQVQSAYVNDWHTRLYIKNGTSSNRLARLLVGSITFSPWRENYDVVLQILEERLGKKFFGTRPKSKR